MYRIKRIILRIKKIISWFPIIWNDYDWDHVYFYIILRHKLKFMEQFFRSDQVWSMKAEDCANDMKKCILALDRLIENDYYSLAGGDMLDKKWGQLDMETTPAVRDTKFFPKEGLVQILFHRENIITLEDSINSEREFKQVYKKEDELLLQDIDYLFKQLNKHITDWWD